MKTSRWLQRHAEVTALLPAWIGCAAAVVPLAACSDGAEVVDLRAPPGETPDDGSPPSGSNGGAPAEGNGEQPVVGGPYVATVRVASPDGSLLYSAYVPTLDALTDEAVRGGMEVAFSPVPYAGSIYVPGGQTPTVTKYSVDANGNFIEGDTISFAGVGVERLLYEFNIISPTKAYLWDNQRIIVWDPSTMTLTGTEIDLTEAFAGTRAAGWNEVVAPGLDWALVRPGRFLATVNWWNDVSDIRRSAGALIVDTNTDQVVSLLEDDRLADTIIPTVSDAGDFYLSTGLAGVMLNRAGDSEGAPGGMLRIRNGEDGFDPDFYINLDEAVGGRPATVPMWAGDNTVFAEVYHEEKGGPVTSENMFDVSALPNFQWWKINLDGSAPAEPIAELGWTSHGGFASSRIPSENRHLVVMFSAERSESVVFERTGTSFAETARVTGQLAALHRVDRTW